MSVVGNRYYTSHGSLPACCQPRCTVNTRGTSTSKQINVPCHASALQSRGTAEAHASSWSTRHITLDYSTAHTSNKRTYTMFVIHQLGFTDLLCNSPPLSHTFVTPPRAANKGREVVLAAEERWLSRPIVSVACWRRSSPKTMRSCRLDDDPYSSCHGSFRQAHHGLGDTGRGERE